ncbi:MAG TPA: histidine phosphatase family protein [Stellaceae bacterium]|nr:histidine phosphatase family protein [Stellaceae bacterium]
MRTLHLLRHAKAAADDPGGDRARPLSDRGQRAARAIGAWMAERKLAPQLVLCSSALRTRQTLALVLPSLARLPEVLYEDDLYLAEAPALLQRLREVPVRAASVLLVGHNPGLHELAVLLAESDAGAFPKRLAASFPTAALASYEVAGDWAHLDRGSARLAALITPKELAAGAN